MRGRRDLLAEKPRKRQEETRRGSTLKEEDSGIISIGWFFHIHAIFIAFSMHEEAFVLMSECTY